MHAIERELIKITGYKPPRKFSDREDYLKSLLNAVVKLSDEDFDELTEEAATWTNAAVAAQNLKNGSIPDFDEIEVGEDEDEDELEADDSADDAALVENEEVDDDTDDPDEDDENEEVDDDSDDDSDDDDDAVPLRTKAMNDVDDDDDDDEDEDDEDDEIDEVEAAEQDDDDESDDDVEPDEKPKPAKKAAPKSKAKPEKPVKTTKPAKVAKPEKAAKAEKPTKPAVKAEPAKPVVKAGKKIIPKKPKEIDLDDEPDVVVDKWGCMEGSKNGRALALFEKGATAKEVKDAIGGTYYNTLAKMVANGHTLIKEGSIIRIIHSQDKKKKAK